VKAMDTTTQTSTPLVSVIITCYNHGRYLQEAIESIKQQQYPAIEIIVVDDGSTDHTKEIAEKFTGVKYIYQENQGLSAARNTGIRNSNGVFLTFLDADDWFLPGAIKTNVGYLQQNENLAFVSGGHDKVFVEDRIRREEIQEITSEHYNHLLQGNYIGMHATVMYRRWVFDEFSFDDSLKLCEDYDLYLGVANKYPVHHHTAKIAAYRLHSFNMSANIPGMLATVLQVLARQQNYLNSPAARKAYKKGQQVWKNYYCKELYDKLQTKKTSASKEDLFTLIKYNPSLFVKYSLNRNYFLLKTILKTKIKEHAPAFSLRWLNWLGLYESPVPPVGSLDFGYNNPLKPFSKKFGYDRGGPIDRYYIENFLRREEESVKGRVLEIGDNEYTLLFGGNKITQSDILHVDANNPKATLIGDISNAPQLPDNTFDCIILTQTLHLIYDFKGALRTCYRILKPGGALLLTVPGITPIDHGRWKETWYWSFTDKALQRLMAETFPESNIVVKAFGNVFAATAFLYGLGLPEVPKQKLDYQDPHFQVIITVKAQKAFTS
jgi:glycosyltransferase involved in cell wall biosynthesis